MKQATLHTPRTPHQKPLKYSDTIHLENQKSEEKTCKIRKSHLRNKLKKDQETKEKIDKELTRERLVVHLVCASVHLVHDVCPFST